MDIFDKTVASSLKFVPRSVVRRVARRYIAGETIDDALQETRRLNADGCLVTMDLLGESVTDRAEAEASTSAYVDLLQAIHDNGLDANVSIKPTHFGLSVDRALFAANARRVVDKAAELGNFVRIDMEDSPTTTDTIGVFRELAESGADNVGLVLQARLRRTLADLAGMADLSPSFRICKGVYLEPPEIAWQTYEEINDAYLALLRAALPDERYRIGIATHDDPVIAGAEQIIAEAGLARERYEFQMLLGVRPEARAALVEKGHRVRVYVPFGKSWYAYCVRRLKENPAFAGHVTRDLLKDPAAFFGDGKESR